MNYFIIGLGTNIFLFMGLRYGLFGRKQLRFKDKYQNHIDIISINNIFYQKINYYKSDNDYIYPDKIYICFRPVDIYVNNKKKKIISNFS